MRELVKTILPRIILFSTVVILIFSSIYVEFLEFDLYTSSMY